MKETVIFAFYVSVAQKQNSFFHHHVKLAFFLSDALLSANMDPGWCWRKNCSLIRPFHCECYAVWSEVGEI